MKKIKMRYVAQVEIDDSVDATETGLRPLEDIRESVRGGEINRQIADILKDSLSDNAVINVTTQYADVIEVEDEDE